MTYADRLRKEIAEMQNDPNISDDDERLLELQNDLRIHLLFNPEPRGPYYITYRNQGKPRGTSYFPTREEAQESADFLKWQGATSVRIQYKLEYEYYTIPVSERLEKYGD